MSNYAGVDVWVWLIILVGFISSCISLGTTYATGALFTSWLERFEAGPSTTSWIPAVQDSTVYISGVLLSPMLKIFTYRQIIVGSCTLSAAGFCLSALAPNVYYLFFTYGFLTGLGNGILHISSMVVTQHYVTTRRGLVAGLVSAGGGVGITVISLLIKAGIRWRGWQVALLLEGVVVMMCAGCALLVNPDMDQLHVKNITGAPECPNETTSIVTERKYPCSNISQTARYSAEDNTKSNTHRSSAHTASVCQDASDDNQLIPSKSIKLKEINNQHETEYEENKLNNTCCSGCVRNRNICVSNSHIPELVLVSVAIGFFGFGYNGVFTYISLFTKQVCDVGDDKSNLMVTFLGVSNIAGRLLCGWMGDIGPRTRYLIESGCLILAGVGNILLQQTSNYNQIILYSMFQGFCLGGFASLMALIILDSVGLEDLSKAAGICMLTDGIGALTGPTFLGWLIEATGNIDNAFLCIGGIEIAAGLLVSISYLLYRRRMQLS